MSEVSKEDDKFGEELRHLAGVVMQHVPTLVERFVANRDDERMQAHIAHVADEASQAWIQFAAAAILSGSNEDETTSESIALWAAQVADEMLNEWSSRFGLVKIDEDKDEEVNSTNSSGVG